MQTRSTVEPLIWSSTQSSPVEIFFFKEWDFWPNERAKGVQIAGTVSIFLKLCTAASRSSMQAQRKTIFKLQRQTLPWAVRKAKKKGLCVRNSCFGVLEHEIQSKYMTLTVAQKYWLFYWVRDKFHDKYFTIALPNNHRVDIIVLITLKFV